MDRVAAQAAGPQHYHFTFGDQLVDTTSCSFPITGSFMFTNDVTEWDDANGVPTRLQLHQTFAATLVGNGVTLAENDHEQTFVAFVDGNATQAIHVGSIFHMTGPSGRLTLIAGRQVFAVEHGFDHRLISETGVHLDFSSDAAFCAAFA
jgi:hypothetical protein